MTKKWFSSPWLFFVISLAHQFLVLFPGEFPVLFPDSASYLTLNNAQRTPFYPLLLHFMKSPTMTALAQCLFFALAVATFSCILRMILEKMDLPSGKDFFILIGSLYFATNFELIQF